MRAMQAAFANAKVRAADIDKPVVQQVLRGLERAHRRQQAAKQRRGGK